ncbi:methyltransferase domain-containing protein [uncultured Methanobrevibacter sp.]|uniref:methyltransferase domain-containing protein n=1 Tax=uncultured Methanobrevibacter sp. TaxID=253161 RepID=UPI00260D451F|nr:methyltransferase domain-containing protein [uncultured Methanobrevibacter sp.]
MKFKTTPYHFDLLKDGERISAFYEAINALENNHDLAYDLGCGSGILSFFLNPYFNKIIAIEQDVKSSICAEDNLKQFNNIHVLNEDVLTHDFSRKADLIVCEMLDTALIDEEEVPVLNHARKCLKKDGKIIPEGIINIVELASLERNYIHYDENVNCEILSNPVIYDEINFLDEINPNFEKVITLKANKNSLVNGIKITTITKLNDNLVCGPTPMLNPPLLIPLDEKNVKCNDLIKVKLKYIMGKGIGTIEANYY